MYRIAQKNMKVAIKQDASAGGSLYQGWPTCDPHRKYSLPSVICLAAVTQFNKHNI